jgi:hypothetical protein
MGIQDRKDATVWQGIQDKTLFFKTMFGREKKRQFNIQYIDLRMTAACTGLSALRNQWLEHAGKKVPGSQARHAARKLLNKYLLARFNEYDENIYKCIEHMHRKILACVFIFLIRMVMCHSRI